MGSSSSKDRDSHDDPLKIVTSSSSLGQSSSSGGPPMTSAARTWNIAAAATVLGPLFLFFVGRIFLGDERDGGGGEEDRGAWSWWGNNKNGEGGGEEREGGFWSWLSGREQGPDERNGGALVFAYLWTLLCFGALIWLGNQVLGANKKDKSAPALFVALVAFSNLAFLCWILVQNQMDLREEDRWLSQFPAAMVLTFISWIVFGVVYAILLQRKYGAMEQLSPKEARRNSSYRRTNDDGDVV